MIGAVATGAADHEPVIEAVRETLTNKSLDPAFVAEAVLLPSEAFIGDQMKAVDPDAIHLAREALRADLGQRLEPLWRDAYTSFVANRYDYNPVAKGARRLRTIALGYIMAAGAADAAGLAKRQYDEADNMTDRQGALGVLVNGDAPERAAALAAFYDRYRDNALVLDKWFTAQALSTRADTAGGGRGAGPAPGFLDDQPEPAALSGRRLLGQPARLSRRLGARLPLPRRHDHRRGQAQPADRGQAGAAARALAPLRRSARAADAGGAGADRGDAGPQQGRVRAGQQEPGMKTLLKIAGALVLLLAAAFSSSP